MLFMKYVLSIWWYFRITQEALFPKQPRNFILFFILGIFLHKYAIYLYNFKNKQIVQRNIYIEMIAYARDVDVPSKISDT